MQQRRLQSTLLKGSLTIKYHEGSRKGGLQIVSFLIDN